MPAVSKKQQRFFGIVRAAQKGTLKGEKTLEVQRAAASMKRKDVKKFASTKHKGLPEKKKMNESVAVKELEDGLAKLDYPSYGEVDDLMKKISSRNGIDTTLLHMQFKAKHLMIPDDWAKKKMFEPVMIPKTDGPSIQKEYVQGTTGHDGPTGRRFYQADKRYVKKEDPKVELIKNILKPKQEVDEGNLHKWFKGSKSKDGKGGWVNVVTGGTCASDEPGEGTPKCVSSSKRASMSKSERKSAARRKKAADPNQQSKSGAAKPTYVSTDKKKKVNEEKVSKDHPNHPDRHQDHPDMSYKDAAKIRVEKKTARKQVESGNRSRFTDKYYPEKKKDLKYPVGNKIVKTGKLTKEQFTAILEDAKMHRQTDINLDRLHDKFSKMDQSMPSNKHMLKRVQKEKKRRQEKAKKETLNPTTQINDSFEINPKEHKDAQKKQKMRNLAIGNENPNEKKVAEKKAGGPKMMGEAQNAAQQAAIAVSKKKRLEDMMVSKKKKLKETVEMTRQKWKKTHKDFRNDDEKNPRVTKYVDGKGTVSSPVKFTEERVEESKKPINYKPKPIEKDPANMAKEKGAVKKGEPDYRTLAADHTPDLSMTEAAAWTRKAGKNSSGGLNEKGRKSYERENPGSDLKAPSKKKGNKRRASFCARMKGMKSKLTSAKTARDPDSRINKSLRAWNCGYEPETGELISEKLGGMVAAVKRKKAVLKQPMKAMDAGARGRRILQRKEHQKYVSDIIPDHLQDQYAPVIEATYPSDFKNGVAKKKKGKPNAQGPESGKKEIDEAKKKCGEGEYYCNDDKKCKSIPKGYRIGYGGMLKPENESEETKGKNGNGNGHGNGNGNGNGGNGGGGNGNGGNGGGE